MRSWHEVIRESDEWVPRNASHFFLVSGKVALTYQEILVTFQKLNTYQKCHFWYEIVAFVQGREAPWNESELRTRFEVERVCGIKEKMSVFCPFIIKKRVLKCLYRTGSSSAVSSSRFDQIPYDKKNLVHSPSPDKGYRRPFFWLKVNFLIETHVGVTFIMNSSGLNFWNAWNFIEFTRNSVLTRNYVLGSHLRPLKFEKTTRKYFCLLCLIF